MPIATASAIRCLYSGSRARYRSEEFDRNAHSKSTAGRLFLDRTRKLAFLTPRLPALVL